MCCNSAFSVARRRRVLTAFVLCFGLGVLPGGWVLKPTGVAWADWTQQAKLKASDLVPDHQLGGSVSISGDYVIAGATGDGGDWSGAAYIFKRTGTTWQEVAKLRPPDPAPHNVFGINVAIDGSHAIVGERFDDDKGIDSGSAFIFREQGGIWSRVAKLTPPGGAAGAWFGHSVSIYQDYAVVGAPFHNGPAGIYTGKAFVFEHDGENWQFAGELAPSDTDYGRLGWSVAVNGEYAIVGAHLSDHAGIDSGSAYVFKRGASTWNQVARLNAGDAAGGDFFGFSVAIDGNLVVAGAERKDVVGTESGAAYVFQRQGETWVQTDRLIPDNGSAEDRFGHSVGISGEVMSITAINLFSGSSGPAYIFERSQGQWDQIDKIVGSPFDGFGYSADIDGRNLVVGAFWEDSPGAAESGAAYVYVPEPTMLSLLALGGLALIRRRRRLGFGTCGAIQERADSGPHKREKHQ